MFGISSFAGAPFSSLTGAVYPVSVSEAATGADSVAGLVDFLAAFSDSATVSDSPSAAAIFVGSLSDSATGSDSIAAGVDFVGGVN